MSQKSENHLYNLLRQNHLEMSLKPYEIFCFKCMYFFSYYNFSIRQTENKLLCCSFTNRKNTNRQVKGLSCVHAHACSFKQKKQRGRRKKSLSNHQSQTRKPVVYSCIGFMLRSWGHSRVKLLGQHMWDPGYHHERALMIPQYTAT